MNSRCNFRVRRGSGRSRRNFFSSAATCTGLSLPRSTFSPPLTSIVSASSRSRRMLPFLRKTPSTDMSIWRMADTASSTKAGMRRAPGPTPSVDSAPSLSIRVSSATPNTPFFLPTFLPSFLNALPNLPQNVGLRDSIRPRSSSRLKWPSRRDSIDRTATCRTIKYSRADSSEKYFLPRCTEGSAAAIFSISFPPDTSLWCPLTSRAWPPVWPRRCVPACL